MLGVLFLIFQCSAGARNGKEGGVDWGMTRPKTDERARNGRLPIFFLFPPPLPVCGDLLIVQTCLLCKIRNKCVGSRRRLQKKKKRGGRCLKNLTTVGGRILSVQKSLHTNSKLHQIAVIALKYWLASQLNRIIKYKNKRIFSMLLLRQT